VRVGEVGRGGDRPIEQGPGRLDELLARLRARELTGDDVAEPARVGERVAVLGRDAHSGVVGLQRVEGRALALEEAGEGETGLDVVRVVADRRLESVAPGVDRDRGVAGRRLARETGAESEREGDRGHDRKCHQPPDDEHPARCRHRRTCRPRVDAVAQGPQRRRGAGRVVVVQLHVRLVVDRPRRPLGLEVVQRLEEEVALLF
jgi:hypothetical protein